jgi:hypothetical protein
MKRVSVRVRARMNPRWETWHRLGLELGRGRGNKEDLK